MFTFFSIWFLASAFWHTVSVLKSISYFVSISSVTFWHLHSTHAFKGARSLPEAVRVLTLGIQTRHSRSIWLHACAPEYSRNLLSAQQFYLTLFTCKIICFLMWTSTSLYNSRIFSLQLRLFGLFAFRWTKSHRQASIALSHSCRSHLLHIK